MKLASTILSLVMVVASSAAAAPKSSAKQPNSAKEKKGEATPVPTPKNDVAKADTKEDAKPETKAAAPIIARRAQPRKQIATRRLPGEAFVAPSIASLGEKWADGMTDGEIGSEADRKVWTPAIAFGTHTPFGDALSVEIDGSATRFSAPVPGGRTEGWVGHVAGRAGYERGRFGGEAGVLVRVADLSTPETSSKTAPRILPSVEVHLNSGTGTQTFVAAWDNPLLPYGDEGWLRAGARRNFGRLSGELAVGIDPLFAGEEATGPVLESRLEYAAGKGFNLGVAMRAADEPMAALVVRRVF